MKTIFTKFAFLVLVTSFLMTACGEDKDDGGGVPASGKLTITLGGKKVEMTGFLYLSSQGTIDVATISGYNATASGDDINGASVLVYALNDETIEKGDFPMLIATTGSQDKYAIVGFTTSNTSQIWLAQSGTVTITKKTDTELQGTFSGVAALSTDGTLDDKNTKSFSGGFNVKPMSY